MVKHIYLIAGILFIILSFHPVDRANKSNSKGEWIALFNRDNLEGWIPKFNGYDLGVNYKNTFRVTDGYLTVSYDKWDQFNDKFGHLIYKKPYSHYKIRAEYRFTGQQVAGAPDWAYRNNGIKLHSQAPETIGKHQELLIGVEVQLLGGNGRDERPTANVCTAGTNVVMDNDLITKHCTNSTSETYHGDEWVTVEAEVRGSELIEHFVNGESVLKYSKPQYDPRDESTKALIKEGGLLIDKGHIAIQAESHPTQFRKIEIKLLAR